MTALHEHRLARRWAVVPAKSFARAKSRLAHVLAVAERQALASDMLEVVLDAVIASSSVDAILVATDGADVARLAEQRGAHVLADLPGTATRLGDVVDRALAHVAALGASEAVVVMADLPAIASGDVRALAEALAEADVALAPDQAGLGTNALSLRLATLSHTQLGHADSFARHVAEARRLGLHSRIVERPGLASDVDTPDDLARLVPAAAQALAHPDAAPARARARQA